MYTTNLLYNELASEQNARAHAHTQQTKNMTLKLK